MTKVIVNDSLRNMLHNLSQPLELCDESGRILARVLPAIDLQGYENLAPQVTSEELQRRKRSKGKTYSTSEVLAHLEKL